MTSTKKITASFERLGYNRRSKIQQHKFYQLLDELLGEPFDNDVAAQLWEQAVVNSKEEAQLGELIEIINKAQIILNEKTNELAQSIRNLEYRIKQVEEDRSIKPQQKSLELVKLNEQREGLVKDKEQFEIDLHLVTYPFGITKSDNFQSKYVSKFTPNVKEQEPEQIQPVKVANEIGHNDQLKYIMWITVGIAVIELIMMFTKYDFLNLIVIVSVSSIFLLNYFDALYIKLCLGLTIFSWILDLVWLILYASHYWNPPLVDDHLEGEKGFLKFIVFFTVVILIAKLPLIGLLFRFRNIGPQSNYSVSLIGKAKISLSANRPSLITDSIQKK